ncbi:MAG: hypothetical protein M1829_006469 [Trizodia sp. TS-e1964]|nr:MAG: hypothetical protein M1829_006469 [Trizodia sp. TS-e1964]
MPKQHLLQPPHHHRPVRAPMGRQVGPPALLPLARAARRARHDVRAAARPGQCARHAAALAPHEVATVLEVADLRGSLELLEMGAAQYVVSTVAEIRRRLKEQRDLEATMAWGV